jgi:hypothetical protein
MDTSTDRKRRNRLAYLALYYAIRGDEERSEYIRRLIRRMEGHSLGDPERITATPVAV